MNKKLKVGVLGGTGLVGQRFITLLENHPYFEISAIAASGRSEGKSYSEAVKDRWLLEKPIPSGCKDIIVKNIYQIKEITNEVDFVFCAVNMDKTEIKNLEEAYAKNETPVISNNSAHRFTPDVPMIIPEINPEHLNIIKYQMKRLNTSRGFIVVKPNCSIQSYVPAIHPLLKYSPQTILACTYQAISGAGKTFKLWPEMIDNVIPYIAGEEEKSEKEPLKIWGKIENNIIVLANKPSISTQCLRVPASNGHMAAVYVSFEKKPGKDDILRLWNEYKGKPQLLSLPSAPEKLLTYFDEPDRPQTALDREIENGMGISIGRLREDNIFDYKFVCLSHNTLRGAAGGALLTAELLKAEGYLTPK